MMGMMMEEDDLEMDDMERSRLRRQRISAAIKSAVTFLISHLGLATMVIAYSIMGGFLFMAIEAPHEAKEKIRIRSIKNTKIVEIRQLAELLCIRSISAENFTAMVNDIQVNFQTQVFLAVKNNGWDGKEETDEATTQWSFAGSLLYAVTVITTIGYGHVAPKTVSGRLVTILYALVGIPLTFLYLSNMGNFMAECFRLFYKKVCCGMCIFCINRRQPIDDEYERMEMAAQSNYAFHDADDDDDGDDGKVATVYGDADIDACMLRPNAVRTTIICPADRAEPPPPPTTTTGDLLDERKRRKSRTDWERHSISRSTREDERDRKRRLTPSNGTALPDAKGSKYQETQFNSKRDGRRGSVVPPVTLRERGPSQGTGSVETEARYSTTTEEETSSQKEDGRCPSQKKLLSDFGNGDRLSYRKADPERNRFCGRREWRARGLNANGERLVVPIDKRRLMKRRRRRRRHSLESGMDEASTLMFDKSVGVSEDQFRTAQTRRGTRDAAVDGLRATSSSSSNPLFEGSRSSERPLGIKGHRILTPTPSGESGALPTRRKSRSSASDISPNSNATEASLSGSKDYIPLRRLPSRSKVSTSQQGLNDQSNDVSWTRNGVPQTEEGPKCVTEVEGHKNTGDDDDDDDGDEEEDERQRVIFGRMMVRRNRLSRSESVLDDSEVSVPISICLIIIGLYIFSGSLLFTMWEDWDYLTGSYFCFVTLSTIGFGDIVPGTDMKEWAASQKLILCSLWLVVGLSLLAMCFNLMQEEVKDKCKWLGRKVGILKDD